MVSFFRRVRLSLEHLSESVRSNYGEGRLRYLKFLYFSVLRLNTFNVYEFRLDIKPESMPLRGDLQFMELSPENLDMYRDKGFSQEFYIDAVGELSTCHLVLCNNQPAYIHWIHKPGSTSRFLNLGDRSAEINYIHTRPDFRRKGICQWALGMGLQLLSSQGIEKAFTVVHTDNVASCGAMESAGFNRIARIRSIGPFNTRMTI